MLEREKSLLELALSDRSLPDGLTSNIGPRSDRIHPLKLVTLGDWSIHQAMEHDEIIVTCVDRPDHEIRLQIIEMAHPVATKR